jgi:putative ABC transport system permease protein
VALTLTLLTVTVLLAESFVRVMNVDRGFSTAGVLVVPFSLPANRYDTERARVDAFDRVLTATRALPGVVTVSTISMRPLSGEGQVNTIAAEGSSGARSAQPTANFRFVAPDFFRTLGIPILRGRAFADRDRAWTDRTPALVSEPAARELWPGQDPLGKRFSRGLAGEPALEVVGVVADAKLTSLERTPPLMVYVPFWWRSRAATSLLIKSAIDRAAMLGSVRRAVADVDPDIAVGDARPLIDIVDAAIAERRYQTQLFVAFGLVALSIAAIGVYGVTSYGASRRRREMNIRVALGARRAQVVALVARQAMASIGVGILAGVIAAIAAGGVVASLLFEVRARNPLVVAGVSLLVAGVGMAASVTAARRALAIDPAAALHEE